MIYIIFINPIFIKYLFIFDRPFYIYLKCKIFQKQICPIIFIAIINETGFNKYNFK